MASKNDVTGDSLRSKVGNNENFSNGWDLIWGNKKGSTVGYNKPDIEQAIKEAESDEGFDTTKPE